jgi:Sec-independent protein translocase protein TatA
MELFNIGAPEFLFIVLLVFIVLGPKRAVDMAGQVGRWVRDLVKSPFWRDIVSTSKDIKDIPRKIMDEAEIQNTIDEIERSTKGINQELNDIGESNKGAARPELFEDPYDHRIYPGDNPQGKH